MQGSNSTWLATVACVLAGACAASRQSAQGPAPVEAALELLRLEVEPPAPPERRPRPVEGAAPAAFVPREIRRALSATVTLREVPGGEVLSRETFHLAPDALSCTNQDGVEWWLARNSVNRMELQGAFCHPEQRVVIEYTAGDLRLEGMEGYWDRCAALGGVGELPPGMRPGEGSETRFGLEFRPWRPALAGEGIQELWWNEEHNIGLRVVIHSAGRTLVREIEALEWGPDLARLSHPSQRYPGWGAEDLCDWQESCGPSHAAAHAHGADAGEPHGH